MKSLILFSLLYASIFCSSYHFSNQTVSRLATELETDIPGSTRWLFAWAKEEEIFDNFLDIVSGRPIAGFRPRSKHFQSISYTLFYQDPKITKKKFLADMRKIFDSLVSGGFTISEIEQQYVSIKSSVSVPLWFMTNLRFFQKIGTPVNSVLDLMVRLVDSLRAAGTISPLDSRFNRGPFRIRGLTHIWYKFGGSARFDAGTGEWIMPIETQRQTFRFLAIMLAM
jgi:hypothetical protein